VAAFVANVVGGFIYGSVAHELAFAVGAGFALVGTLLGWLWMPRRGALRFAEPAAAPAGQPVAGGAGSGG
jgi:hypothetical protein